MVAWSVVVVWDTSWFIMTVPNTVEPVCGVELFKSMADKNVVVFRRWLQRCGIYSLKKYLKESQVYEFLDHRRN